MPKPSNAPPGGPRSGLVSHPYVILALTTLFWGGNVVAGKAAVGHVDPYTLSTLRWLGAFLVVLPFALRAVGRDWPVVRTKWWLYLLYGAVGFAGFNILVYAAAYYTSGVNVALDQVAINIFVMIASFVLFRTRVKPLQIAGVVITIVGVATTATHGDLGRILSLNVNLGDAFVLLACVAYAGYSIALRYRPPSHWLTLLIASLLGAVVGALVFQATFGGGPGALVSAIPDITPLGWLIVLYTIVLPSAVSQALYVRGVELIGANRATLFINLIPFWGAIGSVLLLGEALETYHLAAGGLIIAGIVLAEWAARRDP